MPIYKNTSDRVIDVDGNKFAIEETKEVDEYLVHPSLTKVSDVAPFPNIFTGPDSPIHTAVGAGDIEVTLSADCGTFKVWQITGIGTVTVYLQDKTNLPPAAVLTTGSSITMGNEIGYEKLILTFTNPGSANVTQYKEGVTVK